MSPPLAEPGIAARHFPGAHDSPEVITLNAIAADAMTMRIIGPKWSDDSKKQLATALAVGVDFALMALEPRIAQQPAGAPHREPPDADALERELVRIAALCVRLIEGR